VYLGMAAGIARRGCDSLGPAMIVRASRLAAPIFGAVAVTACGATSGLAQAGTRLPDPMPTPVADTFHARVIGATGRFSGDGGSATVLLRRGPGPRNATTSFTMSVEGVRCRSARHCLHLGGQLIGRMTPRSSLADVGRSYLLTAAGTVSPLGHLRASGTAAGTGFIRSGHTRLMLTLHPSGGTVTLSGESPAVPAFTQP
jgi:hypothetical protein